MNEFINREKSKIESEVLGYCDVILMLTALYYITSHIGVNFCKKFKVFHFTIFTKFLTATELRMFVFLRVTVNTPLVRASLIRITRMSTHTGAGISVNAAFVWHVITDETAGRSENEDKIRRL